MSHSRPGSRSWTTRNPRGTEYPYRSVQASAGSLQLPPELSRLSCSTPENLHSLLSFADQMEDGCRGIFLCAVQAAPFVRLSTPSFVVSFRFMANRRGTPIRTNCQSRAQKHLFVPDYCRISPRPSTLRWNCTDFPKNSPALQHVPHAPHHDLR